MKNEKGREKAGKDVSSGTSGSKDTYLKLWLQLHYSVMHIAEVQSSLVIIILLSMDPMWSRAMVCQNDHNVSTEARAGRRKGEPRHKRTSYF
jgi:hypothetical protein